MQKAAIKMQIICIWNADNCIRYTDIYFSNTIGISVFQKEIPLAQMDMSLFQIDISI